VALMRLSGMAGSPYFFEASTVRERLAGVDEEADEVS
jgi:hypothetical protein